MVEKNFGSPWFQQTERRDCVIAVESEETERFDIEFPPPHARVTVAKAKSVVRYPGRTAPTPKSRGVECSRYMHSASTGKILPRRGGLLSEMPDVPSKRLASTRLRIYRSPHVVRTDSDQDVACVLDASAEKRTATAPSIRQAGTATNPAAITPTARTTESERSVTALVDVDTLHITDIHSTTSKKHDAKIGPQVARRNAGDLRTFAADRGYDAKAFRDELRENGIRPLIKHRIMNPRSRSNARMDGDRYHQRSMSETVFSSIKRTLGAAVRARIMAGVP